MKHKRPERVERRRALAEINLVGEQAKERARRRGCMPFAVLVLALAMGALLAAGLHLI